MVHDSQRAETIQQVVFKLWSGTVHHIWITISLLVQPNVGTNCNVLCIVHNVIQLCNLSACLLMLACLGTFHLFLLQCRQDGRHDDVSTLKVIADLLQNQHSAHSFGFTTQHACVVKTHFGRKLNIRSFMQLIHEYYHPAHLFTQWLVTSRWQQLQSTLLCLQKTSSILQPLYADLQ